MVYQITCFLSLVCSVFLGTSGKNQMWFGIYTLYKEVMHLSSRAVCFPIYLIMFPLTLYTRRIIKWQVGNWMVHWLHLSSVYTIWCSYWHKRFLVEHAQSGISELTTYLCITRTASLASSRIIQATITSLHLATIIRPTLCGPSSWVNLTP